MKLKSQALHFQIVKGNTKPSGYIRNSYREDGKVKHQTISRINGLSMDQLLNLKAAFDGKTIRMDDITLTDGREYGASNLLFELSKKIGLDKILYSRCEPWVANALALIIGRIVYQGSKLSLSRVPDISYLWEICGVDGEIDVNKHCYCAMDEIIARQNSIQKKLAKKHLDEGCIILYDITSSYFEGEYEDSDFVKRGYNRDKKRGKKQITIGLICTKNGCPVAVEVFAGNTTDSTTVVDKIDEIKTKYGISNFVFVGDRGMLTQKNLDATKDVPSITALKRAKIRELCTDRGVQLSLFDEDIGTEIILDDEPDVRYILRKNPVREKTDKKTRDSLIQTTKDKLAEIAHPKKKTDAKTLAARAAKVFAKYKTEKYFSWDIENLTVIYSVKDDVVATESEYDGLYVLRSHVSPEMMSTVEIVEAYKSLINVENAFRNMKTVQLEIRPIFHHKEERIKAHAFICMLSYYLLWHMNQQLKPMYAESKKDYTQDHVIEIMKTLQKFNLAIGDIDSPATMVAKPNKIQDKIQKLVLE